MGNTNPPASPGDSCISKASNDIESSCSINGNATKPRSAYDQRQRQLADQLQRPLTREERQEVSKSLCELRNTDSMEDERLIAAGKICANRYTSCKSFLVASAYTPNYDEGVVCSAVNQEWCQHHGYIYLEIVPSISEMNLCITPRTFSGWYKIHLLMRLVDEQIDLKGDGVEYVVWIDADALIISRNVCLESLVQLAEYRELIISEDKRCLLNTGVMLLRVCEWTQNFLREVWEERRYFKVAQFEQSAFESVLKRRYEGLHLLEPYHWLKGGPEIKQFAHTCVMAAHMLNSNVSDDDVFESNGLRDKAEMSAKFIFHPYGRKQKMKLLIGMVMSRGVKAVGILGNEDFPFDGGQKALLTYVKARRTTEEAEKTARDFAKCK